MEDINENFKGVWIPKEILNLEIKDKKAGNLKILLSMIISLEDEEKGCYAKNKYFAEILNLTPNHISDMITYLFDNMLISRTIFQDKGNTRMLRSLIENHLDNSIKEKDNTYKEITGNPIMEKDNTYKEITGNPIMEKPIHDNIDYKKENKKDEREILPLDFLNFNFSKEFEEWKTKKGNKIFKKEDFREGFNNKVRLKKIKLNKDLLMVLDDYSRHWVNNQTDEDKPYKLGTWNDFEEDILKKQKERENAILYLEKRFPYRFKRFLEGGKPQIKDYKKFELDFNKICLDKQIHFSENFLFDKLRSFFKNWPEKYEPDSTSQD